MVPLALSSYPSLHRSSSDRFTPLFLTATPPFLDRYPAFRTIHRVVYASVTVQERVPERVPVKYNSYVEKGVLQRLWTIGFICEASSAMKTTVLAISNRFYTRLRSNPSQQVKPWWPVFPVILKNTWTIAGKGGKHGNKKK